MQPNSSMSHDYTPTPKVREIGRQMAADLRAEIHPDHATPESIAACKAAAAKERAQFFDAHNAYVSARIRAKQDLILMVDAWGFETVERWVANMKAMSGRKESR